MNTKEQLSKFHYWAMKTESNGEMSRLTKGKRSI